MISSYKLQRGLFFFFLKIFKLSDGGPAALSSWFPFIKFIKKKKKKRIEIYWTATGPASGSAVSVARESTSGDTSPNATST